MPGKWEVSSNRLDGKRVYIVYRKIDPTAVDHSGNREYRGKYTDDYKSAQFFADYLNAKEAQTHDTDTL